MWNINGYKLLTILLLVGLLVPLFWISGAGTSNLRLQISPTPQCNDGGDNDNDSKTDYPTDTGCSSLSDDSETDSVDGGNGGGGGGGINPVTPPVITSAIFSGKGYPGRTVTLLKDAQVAAVTIADPDATFSTTLSNLSGGSYMFSLYAEDQNGIRSNLYSLPVSVSAGSTTSISGVFIAPTILADKSEVKKGDEVLISGQTAPGASVALSIDGAIEIFNKVTSDSNGVYSYRFNTSSLDYGSHSIKTKALIGNATASSYSQAVAFKVGLQNLEKIPKKTPSDLNGDSRINLIDFSIAAFWYKKPAPPANVDLNADGKVDLVDFSIMAYGWTG